MVPAPNGDLYVTDGYRNSRVHRFSADGRKVYFTRRDGDFSEGQRPTAHVYVIPLEKLDKDPLEATPGENGPGGARVIRATIPRAIIAIQNVSQKPSI